jgi:hypothetical protein
LRDILARVAIPFGREAAAAVNGFLARCSAVAKREAINPSELSGTMAR